MLICAAIALRMNALLFGSWLRKSANSSSTLKATTAVFGVFCAMFAALSEILPSLIMILRRLTEHRKLGWIVTKRVLGRANVAILAFYLAACAVAGVAPTSAPNPAAPGALGEPADTIYFKTGPSLRVKPFALFPSRSATSFACAPLNKPGTVAKIAAADIQRITFFEDQALTRIPTPATKPTLDQLQSAEKLLQSLGRFHDSRRVHAPLAANPWAEVRSRIVAQLHQVRVEQLRLFAQTARTETDWSQALRLADVWLAADPSLSDAVGALWARFGSIKLKDGDFAQARHALNQIDTHFVNYAQAEPLRAALRARASALANDAKAMPPAQARAKLAEALSLWPRAPGLRAELDRLNGTYRVLYVGVPELPENLSPATAWTCAERAALDLLYSRLVQVRLDEPPGQRYEPDLAAKLPEGDGLHRHVELRRDAYWSDGERVTAADVRHTAQLLRSTSNWRERVEMPRFEGLPFALDFTFRHGFRYSFAPLAFYVLPQRYRGRTLNRADDPEFAKAPVGSGPFVYVGKQSEGSRTVAVFKANPFYLGHDGNHGVPREIRMVSWKDLGAQPRQPTPQLLLGASERSLDGWKHKGFAAAATTGNRRVYFLAVNHRLAALANADLRRAMAHAIDRDKILQKCFRGDGISLDTPLSGPFPAHCWASCPPPRVPEDPYQPELAKALAKKLGHTPIRIGLKYPADVPGIKEACAAIAEQVRTLCAEVGMDITIDPIAQSPAQMRAALRDRDFELAYHHWDFADDNYWLWPLFDPNPDALRPGGSNFLGYDNDAKLQTLLRAAMSRRQFVALRDLQQSVHAHLYERMPLIPLWQLGQPCLVQSSLKVPTLDPERPFANILDWRLSPVR